MHLTCRKVSETLIQHNSYNAQCTNTHAHILIYIYDIYIQSVTEMYDNV